LLKNLLSELSVIMTHSALSCVCPKVRSFNVQWWGILLLVSSSGWLTGIVPGWSGETAHLSWSTAVWAQTANQIRNYAGAVLDIEPLRRKAYRDVRHMLKGTVPSDVCRLGQLPGTVNSVCSSFFDESADIIRRNNLSINEFNDITQRSKTDPKLMNQIQQELIRQQQER
jgi:hypothetical protein